MVAPSKAFFAPRGHATLEVELVYGESTVTSACAANPLKLLTPRSRGQSVWAYTSSFGGGLVAGDQTQLDLRVGSGARCFIGTQASTKVYRNPDARPCGHVTRAMIEAGALLVFAPDPVQAFAESSYTQHQEFQLVPDAGLVLMDWFTAGRTARGERWEFTRFQSRNDIFVDGKRTFLDSLLLDPADGPLTGAHRLGRFNCIAMLLAIGPAVEGLAAGALEEITGRGVTRQADLILSASRIAGGAVIRMAGQDTETVGRELHRYLQPLTTLLGDDPWARKW